MHCNTDASFSGKLKKTHKRLLQKDNRMLDDQARITGHQWLFVTTASLVHQSCSHRLSDTVGNFTHRQDDVDLVFQRTRRHITDGTGRRTDKQHDRLFRGHDMGRQNSVEVHLAPVIFQRLGGVSKNAFGEILTQRMRQRQVDGLNAHPVSPVVLLALEDEGNRFARQAMIAGTGCGNYSEWPFARCSCGNGQQNTTQYNRQQ